MKTKILFLVVLLALAPPFSTFSYGQAALRGLVGGLLRKAVEKRTIIQRLWKQQQPVLMVIAQQIQTR